MSFSEKLVSTSGFGGNVAPLAVTDTNQISYKHIPVKP